MKKSERQSKARGREIERERYDRQEQAMLDFISLCQKHISAEHWSEYYGEAQRSAGETFHIVEYLVFALKATRVPMVPELRKSLESVIRECEIDRDNWKDLRDLNFDSYWRSEYGYDC
jgi:hypothetical protein